MEAGHVLFFLEDEKGSLILDKTLILQGLMIVVNLGGIAEMRVGIG